MAEALTVVGAIASTIQLIDFTTKVFDRLNDYIHHTNEVPETLREIKLYLPLFIETLQRVQTFIDFGYFNPKTSSVLKDFIDESYSQMVLLDSLLLKMTPDEGDSRMQRSRKAIFSLKEEKALRKIFKNLSGYIEKLLLFQSSVTSGHTMRHTQSLLTMHQRSVSLETSATAPAISIDNDARRAVFNSATGNRLRSLANYSRRIKNRKFSYFLGFSRFGLLWAIQADLNISWGNKGVSILPGLHLQQLVKNTSPGFEIIWKCHRAGLDTTTACRSLIKLFRRGIVSAHDVFPDGTTWLEVSQEEPFFADERLTPQF